MQQREPQTQYKLSRLIKVLQSLVPLLGLWLWPFVTARETCTTVLSSSTHAQLCRSVDKSAIVNVQTVKRVGVTHKVLPYLLQKFPSPAASLCLLFVYRQVAAFSVTVVTCTHKCLSTVGLWGVQKMDQA
jgi:hypothetical protein